MKATYLVISDEDATVGNGSSHATTIAWPDVKRIERAWNPVGILAPRGFVLRIASRSSAASDSLVYASYLAARSDREAVYDAIVALSARYGFELAPDFGTGTSFLKVGRDRES